MRITKILLFSFLCILVSCSEENPVDYNNSNNQAFKAKNGSELTVEQVDYLKNQLSIIVQTEEWADRQAAIESFANKMNTDPIEFKDRVHFETWLTDGGLSKTSFSSINEGLEAFDYAVAKAELVISENLAFYELLSFADLKQGEIIFDQLLVPGPGIENGTNCQNSCIGKVDSCIASADAHFSFMMSAASAMPHPGAKGLTEAIATYAYWESMEGCVSSFNHCMGGC